MLAHADVLRTAVHEHDFDSQGEPEQPALKKMLTYVGFQLMHARTYLSLLPSQQTD
jgi:hypothetical protein